MTTQEIAIAVTGVGILLTLGWNVYQATVGKQKADQIQDARITALETKVGLFWRLVEDHMTGMLAKANPIQLTEDEQAAAAIYDTFKHKSPTTTLKILETALKRELGKDYLSPEETHIFVMILGAIQAQLYDRGEWTPE